MLPMTNDPRYPEINQNRNVGLQKIIPTAVFLGGFPEWMIPNEYWVVPTPVLQQSTNNEPTNILGIIHFLILIGY